jgi:hypothetical protein
MVGAFPPVISREPLVTRINKLLPSSDLVPKSFRGLEYCDLVDIIEELSSRIRELEAQLETLSPGVTRG